MKFTRLFCFGDSWGYGSELNLEMGEKPFANLVAQQLSVDIKNYSVPNQSLGLITRDVSLYAKDIQQTDLVLLVVPPDSRWYTEWETMPYENSHFFSDKSDDWFEYHHQLFIFAVCEILDKIKCQYILMHNYGRFPLKPSNYSFSNFHQDRFLSQKSLTEILTGKDVDSAASPIQIEKLSLKENPFHGIYFEGCEVHPNQLGHEKIAQTIIEKLLTKEQS